MKRENKIESIISDLDTKTLIVFDYNLEVPLENMIWSWSR